MTCWLLTYDIPLWGLTNTALLLSALMFGITNTVLSPFVNMPRWWPTLAWAMYTLVLVRWYCGC